MKRRDFFKRAGWILATLGISEVEWIKLGDRVSMAIASPLNRKLALLVGINQYPGNSPLAGCLTDVELQKELLIHRFGFVESDILILTDKQATRTGIESAFLNHLTTQARNGDTVVFHFSGYGRRLQLANDLNTNSLVTSDALYFSQVPNPPSISARDINTLKRIYQQPTLLGWKVAGEKDY